jgi:hypothetical protein|tara:strand:- start:1584 stop:1781 length:198 start_codon:yes stop_codon:yes gene_type:complete
MPRKENDILYEKILKDVDRYISGSSEVIYTDSDGIQTETIFRVPPTPQELEGLLIWLNKEHIAQA